MRMFIDSFLAEVEDDDADRRGFRKKARKVKPVGYFMDIRGSSITTGNTAAIPT